MKYKIAVDSSCNLPAGPELFVVPMKIVTEDREFVDDATWQADQMQDFLAHYKGRSGTSCPNVAEWLEAFGEAEGIFALCLTGNLSGCYNAAVQAKASYEEQHPGCRVCCLDSLSTGPEMALIVEKLRELIEAGLDFDTIEREIRSYMERTHLIFLLASLNNMARNGRVSALTAKAVGLLGIRILGRASAEGTLEPLQKCRGQEKGLQALVQQMQQQGFRGGRVRIAHCRNLQGAETLAQMLQGAFPGCDVTICQTSALCSFYAEPGGLMVGFES